MNFKFSAPLVFLATILSWIVTAGAARAEGEPQVDTALVVSVDVSNSVDEHRYRLQMEGIAAALEDTSVIQAITNGPSGGILFSMVTWADRPDFVLPWTKISSKEEAQQVAARIRKLPHQLGDFTCMTRMMRSVNDKIVSQIPASAMRVVLDVSGDGPENCNAEEPIESVRDELVENGVTVNGLPINENIAGAATLGDSEPGPDGRSGGKAASALEQWYRDHVKGGTGAFVLPANGYEDFGRAIRQKFVIEISGIAPSGQQGNAAVRSTILR